MAMLEKTMDPVRAMTIDNSKRNYDRIADERGLLALLLTVYSNSL
jgi:hypothetical protein